jgi:hypothetical protein
VRRAAHSNERVRAGRAAGGAGADLRRGAADGVARHPSAIAIILLNGSSSNPTNQTAVYSQKLTSALTPVLAANTTLSSDLQGLSGSNTSQAKSALAQAQSAVAQARGALSALTAQAGSTRQCPGSSTPLNPRGTGAGNWRSRCGLFRLTRRRPLGLDNRSVRGQDGGGRRYGARTSSPRATGRLRASAS